jgi:hypothetical protein
MSLTAPLSRLPAELIANIFSHLDDRDVFAARISNRILERASFAHFGKRFFRKKGFMITTPSLHVLGLISRHPALRKHVQHVWFNPDCYTFAKPDCAPDDDEASSLGSADHLVTHLGGKSKTLDKLATQNAAYQRVMQDHDRLLQTDELQVELGTIFGRLPNLRTVGMRRSEDYSPYGWTILRDAIGQDPRVLGPIPSGPAYDLSSATYLFIAILVAAAATDTQLQRLYTDAIEIDNIREERLDQNTLDKACSSILYIELNAVKGWLNTRPKLSTQPYKTLRRPEDYGMGLVRLLSATKNLREIGLQIFPDVSPPLTLGVNRIPALGLTAKQRKQSHLLAPTTRSPDSWRLSYPYMTLHKISSTTHLAHLTRIKLEKVTSTPATLTALLEPCAKNLTSLKLRDVRLLPSTPTDAAVLHSGDGEPRPWETIFTFLLERCPELDYILLHHLMHDRGAVSFTEEATLSGPAEEMDFLINHIPPSHGGQGSFAQYENITLQAGGEGVRVELERVRSRHWYHQPLFSYQMDEGVWHTDTSDEEW